MPYDFPSGVPTGTVVTVPDGSYRVWDSQKWRAAPSSNAIIPPTGFLPLIGGTITPGSLNIMPPTMTPAAPFAPLFHTSSSFTGTVTPPADGTHPAVHLWEITNDNASYGHSGQTGFRLVHTYGGSGFDGGRTGMTVRLTQVAGATGTVPQASNQQRIALNAEVYACDNAAGTDSTDYTKVAGGIYSINTYTRMYGPGTVAGAGGATNFLDCLGMNMEMLMETGTSVANKSMILFTLDAGDHVQGSIVDACLNFANGGGDAAIVGWQNLLATGRPDGKWPMNWTGNLWGTYHGSAPYRMQVAYGLNWQDIYFTSGAIRTPGFLLDGNGNINTGALQIATSGQTTTLDAKLIHVVSATVVPGSSVGVWGPTMGMYDNLGNQWIPNTLGGTGGTQLLSVTLVSPAYITGPAPTNPVTVISQSGPAAQAQLNLTWSTSPGTLALQPSGGATVFGGPVTLPSGTTGPFLPLATGGTVAGATTFNARLTNAVHMTTNAYDANFTINATAVGSGTNGPATAQTGLTLNLIKDNWVPGTSAVGEIDGLCINVRQGGTLSDAGGMLINVAGTGTGYLAIYEAVSQLQAVNTGVAQYSIRTQEGVIAPATNQRFGKVMFADVGNMTSALHIVNTPSQGYWGNIIEVVRDNIQNFVLDDHGNINTPGSILINPAATGVLTVQGSNATSTVSGANLMWNLSGVGLSGGTVLLNNKGGGAGGFLFGEVTNAGVVTPRLTIDASGNATFAGTLTSAAYHGIVYLRSDTVVSVQWDAGTGGIQFNISGNAAEILGSGGLTIFGTKVIGTQIAGWGASTGGVRGAITGSSTLPQVAAALAQLLTDLKTHGMIGA